MQAIREIREITSNKLTVHIPEEFECQKVEVLILPIESEDEKENMAQQEKMKRAGHSHSGKRYRFEAVSLKTSGYKFNRDGIHAR